MSLARTLVRRQQRDLEAVHLALLAEAEPKTKNTRMAIAGNTGSGWRRRAKRAIARARQDFKPTALVKVIQHAAPGTPALGEDTLADAERALGVGGREQTIQGFSKFVAPKVHDICLYMARRASKEDP